MLNCAIIGYGRAGKIHLNILHEIISTHLDYSNIITVKYLVDKNTELLYKLDITNIFPNLIKLSCIDTVLLDKEVNIVIICSPTETHYDITRRCLMKQKHVFVEKPLANALFKIKHLYHLSDIKNLLLFTAYNRRYDEQFIQLKNDINSLKYGKPLFINVICRDYPFPPQHYLDTCGGIIRDCVVHDLDIIINILQSKIKNIEVTLKNNEENCFIYINFENGVKATFIHSRHSDSYDQRVNVICEKGTLQVKNNYNSVSSSISFSDRYHTSYINELTEFLQKVNNYSNEEISNNITYGEAVYIEKVLDAANRSATEHCSITMSQLRNYTDENNVKNLYLDMRKNQTIDHIINCRKKYSTITKEHKYSILEALNLLNNFIDVSDPDVDIPNLQHAYQTAERLRKMGMPDWLQLTGLIHDIGKILYIKGSDTNGTSIKEQWSIVGDTYILGYRLPDTLIYPELNKYVKKEDTINIYNKNCGLDNCYITYGHDEYLYSVLKFNETKLPPEALYIIRYHSLYTWHTHDSYDYLESEYDKAMKGYVKLFNLSDLYSKDSHIFSSHEINELNKYYQPIIDKYLPQNLYF